MNSTYEQKMIEILDPYISAYASSNCWVDGKGSWEEIYETEMSRALAALKEVKK